MRAHEPVAHSRRRLVAALALGGTALALLSLLYWPAHETHTSETTLPPTSPATNRLSQTPATPAPAKEATAFRLTPELRQAGLNAIQHASQSVTVDTQLQPVAWQTPSNETSRNNQPPTANDLKWEIEQLPPVCQTGLPVSFQSNNTRPTAAPHQSPRYAAALQEARTRRAATAAYVTRETTDDPNTQANSSQPADSPPVYRPRSDLASTKSYFNPHRHATQAGQNLTSNLEDCGPDPHADVFNESLYPSARECAKCHQQIYDEWSTSSHAYAAVSPMFHRFEQKINTLSQGTLGYFCIRCHSPVGTTLKLRRDQPIWDGPAVFREGVTCVACHRVAEQYGKVNGERRMEPGSIYEPVYGAGDGLGVETTLRDRDYYKVKDSPNGLGTAMHRRSIQFEQLSDSTFCVSCHQVAVYPGIKLEVVWDQYIASPAYREGISCQDCHMGKVPGLPEGYAVGPAAVIDQKPINPDRKHSNHAFYGPGYSIAHPGIFPHHEKADRWTFNQWLEFDWRTGWGTDEFEDALQRGEFYCDFPPTWTNVDDRYDAREIIEANLKQLAYKRDLRRQVLENGSRIDGPFFKGGCREDNELVLPFNRDLKFQYVVTNLNSGHNLPTGSLGAQPQLWLNVVLIDPTGKRVWESGYLDSQGDLADLQSSDVLKGCLPHDDQLFNLQTKFLFTNVKGTDREVPIPINWDIDQLPFIRPAPQPVSVLNHPPFIRMEAHSLPPLGSRPAKYRVPAECLTVPGNYRLSIRMRSRLEPIYFMKFVDSTPEMIRAMNEDIMDAHAYSVTFRVE